MEKFAVILPAAGRSARFGGARGKLVETLGGKSVIRHAAEAFLSRKDVAELIVATQPSTGGLGDLPLESFDSRIRFTPGGANRAQSVRAALLAVSHGIDWIAIHDAARPLVSQDLIDRVFAAAREHGAAAPALAVALTVKQAEGPLPTKVQRTLPRHTLWAMQTPQIMRRVDLIQAYETCPLPLEQVTDDAQLLELAGLGVWLVAGEERNLKITTRADLRVAESWMSEQST